MSPMVVDPGQLQAAHLAALLLLLLLNGTAGEEDGRKLMG